jgi:hypothetical protein
MRSRLPGDFISQKRLVEFCDLSSPHQRYQALTPLRVLVAASISVGADSHNLTIFHKARRRKSASFVRFAHSTG